MKTISLKIDDSIFTETENILENIRIPRNRYINEAIDFYNDYKSQQILEKKLAQESALVREESLNVLREFENLGYED